MKVFDFLKNITERVNTLKNEADTLLTDNAKYLKNGLWKSNGTNTILYHIKSADQSKKELSNVNGVNFKKFDVDLSTRIAYIIHRITYRFSCDNKNNDKPFDGDLIIVSTSGKTFRVIDYYNNQLLTKYDSEKRMKSINAKKEEYGKYFNTVPQYESNYQELYTVEKYIVRHNYRLEDAFSKILNDSIQYSKNKQFTPSKIVLSKDVKEAIQKACIEAGIEKQGQLAIEIMQSNDYVKTISHGDISGLNIIYDGNDYYYIDFEVLNERYVLFDIIQFLYWDKLTKNKPDFSDYLSGKYDKEIREILANYGLKYNSDLKEAYLIVFLLENINFSLSNMPRFFRWAFLNSEDSPM